ncbi:MAG: DNA internalization-related competence protein ComEC/Rec2 [Anaerovoracaceae bacterium]
MIRRPLAFSCGVCVAGMASELFFKWTATEIIFIFILSFFALTVAAAADRFNFNMCFSDRHETADGERNRRLCLFFVCIFLFDAGMLHCAVCRNEESVLSGQAGEYVIAKGVIADVRERKDCCSLTILVSETEKTGVLDKKEKMLVNIYEGGENAYTLSGKSVEVRGMTELPAVRRNPKLFDYRVYLKTKKISVVMESTYGSVRITDGKEIPYLTLTAYARHLFKINMENCFGEEAASLIEGMVLGDSSSMSEEMTESFRKNGICHILAVSGLHIGILYGCISALRGKKCSILPDLFIMAVIIAYVALAGFSPSSVRAAIMIFFHILSRNLRKRYDMFTAGSAAMLAMTVHNPLILLNTGFQLSFTAIFTLAAAVPAAQRIFKGRLIPAFVLQAGLAPVSAYTFNYFSVFAVFLNIPVLFIGGILIPLGMLMLLLSVLNAGTCFCMSAVGLNDLSAAGYIIGGVSAMLNFIFNLTAICAEFFSEALICINEIAFIDKVSYRYTVSPPLWLLMSYYGEGLLVCSEYFRLILQRGQIKRAAVCVAAVLLVCLACDKSVKDGFEDADMIFLDVGQGDCLFIKTEDNKTVMIDSGGSPSYDLGEKILLPYCLKNGMDHIDFAVITHFHTDHCRGLESLAEQIPVKKLVLYEGNKVKENLLEEKMNIGAENFIYMTKGDRLRISEELTIEALYPEKAEISEYERIMSGSGDENETCLVTRVEFKGITVMMTGDMDTEGEAAVIEANGSEKIRCDILKVPHHGSRYGSSEAFLKAAAPEIAVIQVGKNNYGHPDRGTLSRLEEYCERIYRNDLHGAVGIDISHKNGSPELEIRTMM